jgi:hypothetical protein
METTTLVPTEYLATECIDYFDDQEECECDCYLRYMINSEEFDNDTYIDNVHVTICIIIGHRKKNPDNVSLMARIDSTYKSKTLWHYSNQKIDKDVETLTEELDTIKNIMKQLKYNKKIDKLVYGNNKSTMQSLFFSDFTKLEECSVCHDQTCSVLSCSHNLCLECMSKLRSKTCPLCRADFSNDNDDDE